MNRAWFLVFAVGLVMIPSRVVAVCLNGHPSVQEEYRQSTYVFIGHVTAAVEVPETKSQYEGVRYGIRVDEVFRGRPGRTISVFSENSSGRFPMDVLGDYLVFLTVRPLAVKAGFPLSIDACGNSGPIWNSAAAIEIVRRLHGPQK